MRRAKRPLGHQPRGGIEHTGYRVNLRGLRFLVKRQGRSSGCCDSGRRNLQRALGRLLPAPILEVNVN